MIIGERRRAPVVANALMVLGVIGIAAGLLLGVGTYVWGMSEPRRIAADAVVVSSPARVHFEENEHRALYQSGDAITEDAPLYASDVPCTVTGPGETSFNGNNYHSLTYEGEPYYGFAGVEVSREGWYTVDCAGHDVIVADENRDSGPLSAVFGVLVGAFLVVAGLGVLAIGFVLWLIARRR